MKISRKGEWCISPIIFIQSYTKGRWNILHLLSSWGEKRRHMGKLWPHIPFDITRCLLFCLFRLRNTQSWSGKKVFKQRERLGQSEILCVHYYFNTWLSSFCKESNKKIFLLKEQYMHFYITLFRRFCVFVETLLLTFCVKQKALIPLGVIYSRIEVHTLECKEVQHQG